MLSSKKPWDKRKWRDGIIKPGKLGFIIVGIMGLLFTGIGGFMALNAENALRLPPNKENVVLLFPLVGICLLIASVVMLARHLKYRGTMLRMETMPGVIGGKFKGVLVIPDVFGGCGRVDISLENQELKTTGSGTHKHKHTHVSKLFQVEVSVDIAELGSQGFSITGPKLIEIPIDLVLPYDTKDETENHGRVTYKWLLKAKADVPGLDMSFEFNVPVFRTADSSSDITIDQMETEDAQEKLAEIKDDVRKIRNVDIFRRGGYEHYVSRGKASVLLIVGVIILAIGSGLVWHGISRGIDNLGGADERLIVKVSDFAFAAVPAFIGSVFLLVGAIIFGLSLFILGRCDVYVAGDMVNFNNRLGPFEFNKQIGRDFIIDIDVKKRGSSGGVSFYAVCIEHTDLRQVTAVERFLRSKAPSNIELKIPLEVAKSIPDKAEALWLADRIKEQLGLPTSDETNAHEF